MLPLLKEGLHGSLQQSLVARQHFIASSAGHHDPDTIGFEQTANLELRIDIRRVEWFLDDVCKRVQFGQERTFGVVQYAVIKGVGFRQRPRIGFFVKPGDSDRVSSQVVVP